MRDLNILKNYRREVNLRTKSLKNKKPVDYSDDIELLNKGLLTLKNKKPVKQIDYSEDIKSLKKKG